MDETALDERTVDEPTVDDRAVADRNGERRLDLGALLIGGWFFAVGLLGMFAGAESTSDALPLLFPLTLVLVGIGLLLPPRRPPTPTPTSELGAGDGG